MPLNCRFDQADLRLLTDKQASNQCLFHILDLTIQGWRRNAQLPGGTCEAALLGDFQKVAK